MNMKKTFAGAMAGALAVSAMATSASAAVPGPGEYVIDLTKEGDAYATVQFTFDADYMLTASDFVTLTVKDTGNILARDEYAAGKPIVAKEIKAEFVGSAGTTKQTVTYTDAWDTVNYYAGGAANMNVSDGFKIPLNKALAEGWGDKQGLYTDKYTTVKEALAIKKSDGKNVYPVIWTGVDASGNNVFAEDKQNELDNVYFDKIVVTAKVPLTAVKGLGDLNARWGYKGKVTATMTGITGIEITNNDADTSSSNKAVSDAQDAVNLAQVDVDAAQKKVDDLKLAKVAAAEAAAAQATIDKLTDPGYTVPTAPTSVTLDSGAFTTDGKTEIKIETLAGKEYAVNGTTSAVYDATKDAAAVKAYNDAVAKVVKYNEDLEAAKKVVNAYTGKTDAEIDAELAVAESNLAKAEKVLADAKEELAAAKKAADDVKGSTFVGVKVADKTAAASILAETLFTSAEKSVVGPKSGIWVDNAKFNVNNDGKMVPISGTVKTVTADIGAYKPDALRQIRDAIGTNTGVTLTFEAKNDFDDAAYKSWLNTVTGSNLNWTATNGAWGTDNTKDSYDVWGESMFTGAIVLNRDFSKQFSQSGLVDWGTKTITFDWDELTEGRFYDAAVVLHSLEIMSTQNVEWVSCTVTVPEQEASSDNADSSQGKTEEPSEIETTPVETEVITAAPVETEAPATEAAPAETTAVAPVENIPTGNAPVALAVIPVALAAAAIIAKKRG